MQTHCKHHTVDFYGQFWRPRTTSGPSTGTTFRSSFLCWSCLSLTWWRLLNTLRLGSQTRCLCSPCLMWARRMAHILKVFWKFFGFLVCHCFASLTKVKQSVEMVHFTGFYMSRLLGSLCCKVPPPHMFHVKVLWNRLTNNSIFM